MQGGARQGRARQGSTPGSASGAYAVEIYCAEKRKTFAMSEFVCAVLRRGKGRIKWRHLGQYRRTEAQRERGGRQGDSPRRQPKSACNRSKPKETTKGAQGPFAANCSVTLLKYSLRPEWEECEEGGRQTQGGHY